MMVNISYKKLLIEIPEELNNKLDRTKEKQMITKSAVVKLALNKYCNEVLDDNSRGDS